MSNSKTIYQVDAFTDEPFKGNPAGVMFVDKTVPTGWMQNMAMEMNLSETAFIVQTETGFKIRYFTPKKEVPLCGHATLASAHIIYELGLKRANDTIHFQAQGGDLSISKSGNWISMSFPQYPLTKTIIHNGFRSIVGFEPIEMYTSSYNWVIAVANEEEEILYAKPEFDKLIENGLGHLMITAKSQIENMDYVHRCFAPLMGINEDPVTGSAQCVLGPLWQLKTGKSEFNAFQLSNRTGKLKVKVSDNRVEISGCAITVFKAELKI